jgi:hypothetical protein
MHRNSEFWASDYDCMLSHSVFSAPICLYIIHWGEQNECYKCWLWWTRKPYNGASESTRGSNRMDTEPRLVVRWTDSSFNLFYTLFPSCSIGWLSWTIRQNSEQRIPAWILKDVWLFVDLIPSLDVIRPFRCCWMIQHPAPIFRLRWSQGRWGPCNPRW